MEQPFKMKQNNDAKNIYKKEKENESIQVLQNKTNIPNKKMYFHKQPKTNTKESIQMLQNSSLEITYQIRTKSLTKDGRSRKPLINNGLLKNIPLFLQ